MEEIIKFVGEYINTDQGYIVADELCEHLLNVYYRDVILNSI